MSWLELPQPFSAMPEPPGPGIVTRGDTAEVALGRLVLALSQLVCAGEPISATESLSFEVPPASSLATVAVDAVRTCHALIERQARVPVKVRVSPLSPESGVRVEVVCGVFERARYPRGLVVTAVRYDAGRLEREGDDWLGAVALTLG